MYKNNFAPRMPGSPASACPFLFKSATTLPLIEPKQGVGEGVTVPERARGVVIVAGMVVVMLGVPSGVVDGAITPSVGLGVANGSRVGANAVTVGSGVGGSGVFDGVLVGAALVGDTSTFRNGVAVSSDEGRIVVSTGGRCPQPARAKREQRTAIKRVVRELRSIAIAANRELTFEK